MGSKGQKTKVASDKSEIVTSIPMACADERAAVEFLEAQRWGDCPGCPRCGDTAVYQMTDAKTGERNRRFLWRCRGCKRQFTVRIGTVFEDSRIPLRHWCYAFWAACSSKKGVSALQIKRMTGLTYKSALFMMHRIRFAMAVDHSKPPKLSGTVEIDETYVGGKPRYGGGMRTRTERHVPVVAMVERGGDVRVRVMDWVTTHNLRKAIHECVDPSQSRLMTDQAGPYISIGREFAGGHGRVYHSGGEYVNPDDRTIHSNTVESFFSLLKRGIMGTFHNVSKHHLHRYLAEFELRYNARKVDDGAQVALAIRGAEGKRLRYRQPVGS